MWSFLLLFILFCSSCHGSVTCKNNNGHDVDWYILYKAPEMSSSRLTGSEFLYIDPEKKERLNNINSPQGVLARTLQPLFKPIREMEPSFGFISYSDQPPGCSADQKKFGHSKGVVMVDRTSTGVWLLHSTPQFPFRREQSSFWPQSGNKNAQTYICVTFNYDQFSVIGRHLKKIHIFPFEHYIPNDFHRELQDAVKWTEGATPAIPVYTVESLTFRRKEFKIFSKANSEEGDEEVGDLYISIAKNLNSDVYVQTWGCQRDRTEDYCPIADFKVTNVEELSISSLGAWKPTADHSKWCVAVDQNKHWTCIADVNRAISQFKRFGGALCINDQLVHDEFRAFTRLPTCRKRPSPLPPECGSISDDGSLHFFKR